MYRLHTQLQLDSCMPAGNYHIQRRVQAHLYSATLRTIVGLSVETEQRKLATSAYLANGAHHFGLRPYISNQGNTNSIPRLPLDSKIWLAQEVRQHIALGCDGTSVSVSCRSILYPVGPSSIHCCTVGVLPVPCYNVRSKHQFNFI